MAMPQAFDEIATVGYLSQQTVGLYLALDDAALLNWICSVHKAFSSFLTAGLRLPSSCHGVRCFWSGLTEVRRRACRPTIR